MHLLRTRLTGRFAQGCESLFRIDFRNHIIGQFKEGYLSFLVIVVINLQSHLVIRSAKSSGFFVRYSEGRLHGSKDVDPFVIARIPV